MIGSSIFDLANYPRFINGQLEPDDEGTCLCLSGKKYVDCCKSKIEVSRSRKGIVKNNDGLNEMYFTKESKLPSRRFAEKIIKKKRLGYCMAAEIYGDCSCKNGSADSDIRFSHTLSRGVVLKNLCADSSDMVTEINDHIILCDSSKGFDERFRTVPISEASITTSFCKKHDDSIFEDIEKSDKCDYVDDNHIQSLEYALKAITFELFDVIRDVYYLARLLEMNPNVVYDNQDESMFLKDYRSRLALFHGYKDYSDRLINDIKNYKSNNTAPNLENIVVRLKKFSRIEYSLSEVFETRYFVNVVNVPTPVILVSYYPDGKIWNDSFICAIRKLKRKQNERTIREFTEYVLGNAKNIYFNTTMINSLNGTQLANLYKVHRDGFGILKEGQSIFSQNMYYKLYKS